VEGKPAVGIEADTDHGKRVAGRGLLIRSSVVVPAVRRTSAGYNPAPTWLRPGYDDVSGEVVASASRAARSFKKVPKALYA
jgi:hypothetical protein